MKKFLLFSFAFIFAGSLFAQQIAPRLLSGSHDGSTAVTTLKDIQATFDEDFQAGGPGMTTENLDGNTDDPTYNQGFDHAIGWRMDIGFGDGNLFASSNSNFEPAGTANRWLYTPQITGVSAGDMLSFDYNALPLPGGPFTETFEVYITSSIAGATPASTDFSTLIGTYTCTTAGLEFLYASEDISAFAGQDIWVAFRHTSVDQGMLGLDNVHVGSSIVNEIEILSTVVYTGFYEGIYGSTPVSQIQSLLFASDVLNFGSDAQTNVVLDLDINSGLFTDFSTPYASLASGANDTLFTANPFTPTTTPEVYEAAISVSQDQTDEMPENNVDTVAFMVTDLTYMRAITVDAYNTIGNYGVDSAATAVMYDFVADAQIDSLFVYLANGSPVDGTVTLKIWDQTFTEVATTAVYTITVDDNINGAFIQLPLTTPFSVFAGELLLIGAQIGGTTPEDIAFYGDISSPNPAATVFAYINPLGTGLSWYNFMNTNVPVLGCILEDPNSIDNVVASEKISLYPNPTEGILNIENAENAAVSVYSILGDLISTEIIYSPVASIDISDLSNGTYIIKIEQGNNVITKKVSVIK